MIVPRDGRLVQLEFNAAMNLIQPKHPFDISQMVFVY